MFLIGIPVLRNGVGYIVRLSSLPKALLVNVAQKVRFLRR